MDTEILSACTGCLMAAHGLTEDPTESARYAAGVTRHGLGAFLEDTVDNETGEDPHGATFSKAACDVCGDHYAGTRHGLVFAITGDRA